MALTGCTEPRLFTPPLRELTPATSAGFACIAFAERIGVELMPWQRWLLIHGLELREDGTGYRHRTVLCVVARQSGKTTVLALLALWRMLEDPGTRLVLGTSTNLDVAKEAWLRSIDFAAEAPALAGLFGKPRYANGNEELKATNGARYKIAAATRRGGRGLSVDLGVVDELREHHSWDAWSAVSATTIARPDAQIWALSNAGTDDSVVLNTLRAAALAGEAPDLALFEWSAEPGCDIDDRDQWARANPALGFTITEATLAGKAAASPPSLFRVEHLCQSVASEDAALDANGWALGADPAGSVAPYRGALYAGLDVALDGQHVALVAAAALGDGRVRVEPVASWSSTNDARAELPALLAQLEPRGLAWFPGGPANALATLLGTLPYARGLTGSDATVACMGLADAVRSGLVLHNADALLDGQVATASPLRQGDAFRFTRRGSGGCDAIYAAAGAAHLAQQAAAKPRRAKAFVL